MYKTLIFGAAGQVGHDCNLAFSADAAFEVIALDRSQCDAADPQAVMQAVRQHQPRVIINAAAYTAVDKAETNSDAAFALNATLPAILATEARALGSLLVHYSTDYVFDGEKVGAYTETDAPNPQSVYGHSKLAGEIAVQATMSIEDKKVAAAGVSAAFAPAAYILRLSWVYGAGRDNTANNFPKTILRLAKERDSISVVADQHGVPTASAYVVDVTLRLVKHWLANPVKGYEVFHVCGDGRQSNPTTWHAFAQKIVSQAWAHNHSEIKCHPSRVMAISTAEYPTAARRPKNSVLDNTKLLTRISDGGFT